MHFCRVVDRAGPGSGRPAPFDLARLARVDAVINEAIKEQKLPGAVLLVGRGNRTVYLKAYGGAR